MTWTQWWRASHRARVQCLQTLNAALGNIGDHEEALAVAETIATFSGVPSSNVADTSPKQSLLSLVADLGRI